MDIGLLVWMLVTAAALVLLYSIGKSAVVWPRHRLLGEAAASLLLVGIPFIFAASLSVVLQILLATVQAVLLLLALRLVFGRLTGPFLQTSTAYNVLAAAGMIGLLLTVVAMQKLGWQLDGEVLILVGLLMSLLVSAVFAYQTIWTIKHYRARKVTTDLSLKDLPTVTLAIPARNETHALTECLQAAVASDYPKLEILVLDDCSQDKTPEMIRSFAQSGVRFIQGDQPASGWLGRNQALKTLAEHASGEYIVFAGVDTHLEPGSIQRLISYAISNDMAMVSVLPQRREGIAMSTLLWQLRYYWQIVLPVTRRRVPVATQLWLIRADMLRHLGGFKAVKGKITPEQYFARRLFAINAYRFIIANGIGATTAKHWSSQIESAIRYMYPTFKRQPIIVLLGCVLLAGLIIGPFVLAAVLSILGTFNLVWLMAILVCAVFWFGYVLVILRTLRRARLIALLAFPFSLLQELALLVVSMVAYEFGEVNWKGRNVCYPVISVQNHHDAGLPPG